MLLNTMIRQRKLLCLITTLIKRSFISLIMVLVLPTRIWIKFLLFKRIHGKNAYGGGSFAGLAIVKKVLQRYNINVAVNSEIGKGTTFTLDLKQALV